MISTHLILLKLILWPRMWLVLENGLCVLEKNVYSFYFFGCIVLYISIKSNWYILSFSLDDLSIDVSGVLKFHCYYNPVNFTLPVSVCFMYFGATILVTCMLMSIISPSCSALFVIIYSLCLFSYLAFWKICFVWYASCYHCFLVVCIKNLFLSAYFHSLCVSS